MATFNLADLFELLVDAGPDRLAVVAEPHRRTYAEFDERANRVANLLISLGVRPGDHVAIDAGNGIEWVEVMMGCFKARAVPINVNYRYVEAELRYLLDNADCVAAFVQTEYRERLDHARADVPALRHVIELGDEYEAALAAASPARPALERSSDDRYLLYTGGTTGMPKGVEWRHEDIFHAAAGGGRLGMGPGIEAPEEIITNTNNAPMVLMNTTPLMHGGGQWVFFFAIYSGGTSVIYTGKSFDPHAVLALAEREKVHSIQIIGDAMGRPLAEALAERSYDLGQLFTIGNGGAFLSPAVKAELAAQLPTVMIRDSFGASETGSVGAGFGTGSRFQMNPDTTVLDDDGHPTAVGAVGKMAHGGHIPLGYYKDPVKTAATFRVDPSGRRWVVPGDYARREDDGTITLLGRGSVSINSGGEKIYPEEVEGALKAHPAVFNAVVVGTPDAKWGEKVTALVELRAGTDPTDGELIAHCRTLVADYKVPKVVLRVPVVQITAVAKPDYQWAKAEAVRLLS
jgi:acyl-CoA synthetase (AMP-forming)/AMP-acid ligase II